MINLYHNLKEHNLQYTTIAYLINIKMNHWIII